ncbi:MAG: hypothetical protein LUP94_01690 [Candidatus Methanomethylicus sp.]|nr:hypothetical protein [Candidatus Methanomethylicus sp.]
MESLNDLMNEYKRQLKKGDIQRAYRGFMEYFMGLRSHLENNYPDHIVSGSVYYGYMDMTYFSFFPASLKKRKLKIAIVFNHGTFRFEAWLAGINKTVQSEYWKLFKESGWKKSYMPPDIEGIDSILEQVLVETPDFDDLDKLTAQIERGTLELIRDVDDFLSKHELQSQAFRE